MELYHFLRKPGPYSDDDLEKLREGATLSVSFASITIADSIQTRASIELIRSIRQFDKASGELVDTTNVLTTRILWITVAAVFIGMVQLIVAGISLFSSR